jgi:hypothetical protein
MPEWTRIVNTTTKKFLREQEVNVMRNRKLTALMREKGRISYNNSGESLDWKVRYKRAPLQGYADAETLTFPRRNKWKTAALPWRGYMATDSMTRRERLMSKNTEAIVKIYSEVTDTLMEDVEDAFGDEWYIDGNASGNGSRMHGVESFFGTNGTVNISTGAQRSANAADRVGSPSDTYAGLSTVPANYGGSWTGSWPTGTGSAHYDFWSPLVVCYNSTDFSGSADTFAAQGDEAIRYGIIKCQRNKSKKGQMDMILLESTLYEQFLGLMDSKERFIARPGRVEGSLAKLGFTDVINFDGVEVTWEYGLPSNIGYGFNVDYMELRSLQGQLFEPQGPDFDIASQSFRFAIEFAGNLKCNPRHFLKLMTIAA